MIDETLIASIIIIIICVLIIIIIYKPGKYVKSNIDNNEYFVIDNNDSKTSADTLAQIRNNINNLVDYINKNPNKKYYKDIIKLNDKIKHIDISENTKNIYTSYSINKKELVFCIKSKKDNKIHDMNLLMYVVIHEVAHLMCPEYGHGNLFKEYFKYLLDNAELAGLYTPINFYDNPQEYCGMTINSG